MAEVALGVTVKRKRNVRCYWVLCGMPLDLAIMYKILTVIKEEGECNLSRIRERTKLSPHTVSKYVETLKVKGLIEEVRSGRERIFKITKRGLDFIFLFDRILILLGESV